MTIARLFVGATGKLAVVGALLLCAGACATYPANSGHNSFSGYAEAVFRHQNEVTSRLMLLSDSDSEDKTEIDDSEAAMVEACELLNEYAERESSGESMGWRFKRKVQASVAGCDASIKGMEAVLEKYGQGK